MTVKGKVKFFNETKGFPAANAVLSTTYGNPGGGNFTMPDLRGRFFFNLDAGGSGRITSAGGNFDGTVLGGAGGTQSRNISQANLPNVSFAISGITLSEPPHSHTIGLGSTPAGSPNAVEPAVPQNAIQGGVVQSNTTGITISSQGSAASGGSGQQFPSIPPSMGVNCMMRIA